MHEHIGRGLERTTRSPANIIERIKKLSKESGLEDEETNMRNTELVSSRTRKTTQVYRDDTANYRDNKEGTRTSARTNKEKKKENDLVQGVRRSRRIVEQSKGPS